jgi:hypothetical protein
MNFRSAPRPTGFCLKSEASGCVEPFTVLTPMRPSLSGAPPAIYCGIDESTTTCNAILDLLDNKPCSSPEQCGAEELDDARCERVSGVNGRCTYGCPSSARCPVTYDCGPGPTAGGPNYCGG